MTSRMDVLTVSRDRNENKDKKKNKCYDKIKPTNSRKIKKLLYVKKQKNRNIDSKVEQLFRKKSTNININNFLLLNGIHFLMY